MIKSLNIPRRYMLLTVTLWVPALVSSTRTIRLTVGGTISPVAHWQVPGGPVGRPEVGFEMSVTTSSAGTVIESKPRIIKIINEASYPSSVGVTTPKNCSIGGTTKVDDQHVKLVAGTSEVEEGGRFQISSDGTQSIKIRLDPAGNYGAASGEVTCGSNGGLNYSF